MEIGATGQYGYVVLQSLHFKLLMMQFTSIIENSNSPLPPSHLKFRIGAIAHMASILVSMAPNNFQNTVVNIFYPYLDFLSFFFHLIHYDIDPNNPVFFRCL